jgi:hypothetical protein
VGVAQDVGDGDLVEHRGGPVTPPAERIRRANSASSAASTAAMVAARLRSNSDSSSATERCARLATWRSL